MKKFFIIANLIVIGFIGYLLIDEPSITGNVILEDSENGVMIGSVLDYNITDMDTGESVSGQIKDRQIFFTRNDDSVQNFSLIKPLEVNWTYEKDADEEGEFCEPRTYETKLNYYDANNDGVKDSKEFELYGVYVDDQGCFVVQLPDKKFIFVLGEKD